MKRNQQMVKLFLILFICTAVIFSSAYFGSQAIGKLKKGDQQQTASIKVAEKSVSESVPAEAEKEDVLSKATVSSKELPEDLQPALTVISKIEIPAQASFSLLEFAKKQNLETLSTDTLSIIATGIYQAILPTNFAIEERNIGNELPAYAHLGDEAKVDFTQNMDLAFSNPNKTKYTLDLQLNGNSLTVTLKGAKLSYEYKITTKNEQKLMPKTIVQYSPLLTPGQTMVKNAGHNGLTAAVYRQTYKGDILIKSELIGNDYYPPEYRVEIHALNAPAAQSGNSTDHASQTDQQPAPANPDQTGQPTELTTGTQTNTTNDITSQSTNDSDLWGKPNEGSK
ncbi:G5 domain-containing protein [Bacillus sp. EB600]|uniref:VanW family protein n=1 Tax=Bacillus sp. EB600 TaxID=2806345 RepID=UPI00210C6DC6|nr:G5 domain-containing protein [Bacillus sp. EB600]MCQ6278271.1 VanW family protein [Bacillus sp. EB600]